MNIPFFSIVIITRNRAGIIDTVLEWVKAIRYPRDRFELIVVDNGSTDGTAARVETVLAGSDLVYRIETEPRKGICQARNCGIRSARGAWVLFLDDDVLLPDKLLEIYEQAVAIYPQAGAFGGPAQLDPAIPRPWWWIAEFDKTMSCQNYGTEYCIYAEGTNPYGLNMLINRTLLQKEGGFDTRLDYLTGSFADETELFLRMRRKGVILVYVPEAGVIHSVMHDRLHWHNFMNRFRLVGQSHACLDYMHKTWHFRTLPRRMLSAMLMFIKYRSPAVFFTELHAWRGYRQFRESGKNRQY